MEVGSLTYPWRGPDPFDDENLERWRSFVETGDPRVVAVWACSDLSEEVYCSTWGTGCSDDILDEARENGKRNYRLDPRDRGLILRLWERLEKHWPVMSNDPDMVTFDYPLRRWVITHLGAGPPTQPLPKVWEHGVVKRPPPLEVAPGVELVAPPLAFDRFTPDIPASEVEYHRCAHPMQLIGKSGLGPGLVPIFVPPEGCDHVFWASPFPCPREQVHVEIERAMQLFGR